MAADYPTIEDQMKDTLQAITEGGQYWQVGDKSYKRADLLTTFEILQKLAHQNARLTTNNGFGLATF